MEELTTKNQRKLLDMLNSRDVDMIILVLNIVYSLPKPGIYINCGKTSFNLLIRDIAKKISVGYCSVYLYDLEKEQFDKLVQFASENQDIIRTLSKY